MFEKLGMMAKKGTAADLMGIASRLQGAVSIEDDRTTT